MPVGGRGGRGDKEWGAGLPTGAGFPAEATALFRSSAEVGVAQQCEHAKPHWTGHSKIINLMTRNFAQIKKKKKLIHRKSFWHTGHIKVFFSFSSIFIRQPYDDSMGRNEQAVGSAQVNRSGSQNSVPALRGVRQGASKTRAYLIIS